MEQRKINPLLKFILELGPLILFFVIYVRIKDDVFFIAGQEYEGFIIATAIFIPLILFTTAVLWFLTGKLSKMQLLTAILVVFFGGLGIWFNDERFFKMKPTIINFIFAGILYGGLILKKPLLKYLLGAALKLNDDGWKILTQRWVGFFVALAILNEIIWRTQSTDIWVNFKVFGILPITFLFTLSQFSLIKKYQIEE